MRKYSTTPKRIKNKIPIVDDNIRFDDERRLRNALLALKDLDPGWKKWLAKNVKSNLPLQERRVLVERQARSLSMRNFSFLGPGVTQIVIDSDYYFTDDGNLKLYL